MHNSINKEKILPSIIDRIVDESRQTVEYDYSNRILFKNNIRRDLENLFNTRYRIIEIPEHFDHLDKSILNYGLPDLATVNMLDLKRREEFCRGIEKTISYFEPRFNTVNVKYIENNDMSDRTLRFRIEATLHADPLPEKIIFDSILEPVSNSVSIEEA